jgi:predicted homoserine dehydrogenase-like protein
MYLDQFKALEKAGRPLRVGLVGLGAMGKGMAYNIQHTPGMELICVGDTDPKRYDELREIIPEATFWHADDCMSVAECPDIDMFMEACSSIEMGLDYERRG